MASTLLQTLTYPATTAAPNVPADLQQLAKDVEKKVVMVFASSAARTSAFTAAAYTATEGMLAWLSDTDVFEKYTGSAWVRLDYNTAWGVIGGGYYPGSSALAAGVSTSELYLNVTSGAITLAAGRRYAVDWSAKINMNSAGTYPILQLREGITTGSVPVGAAITCPVADTGAYLVQGRAEFDNTSATSKTYGLTGRANASLMTLSRDPQTFITVKDIGPAALVTAL